jgi:hypothetical protein
MKKIKNKIAALVCGLVLLCGVTSTANAVCENWTVHTTCGTKHTFMACSTDYAIWMAHQYQLADCKKSAILITV